MGDTLRIGVLISGGGSNLQSIMDAVASGSIPSAKIVAVISSRKDAFGLERAKKAGIETFFIDPKKCVSAEEYSLIIADTLANRSVGLVCLAGFMHKIENPLISRFAGKIMNIHPALLPKYGGKGMYGHFVHEAVLKSGDQESGPSVHFVDEEYDHGPVILQKKVAVLPGDTPEKLAKRVLTEEHTIYPEAVKLFSEGKLKIVDGKVNIKKSD